MVRRLIQAGGMLSRSPFARSVGSLMALTAVGQGLYIAAAPLLGRLYSPEAFGLYGLFYLFVTSTAMFSCLNYDAAIPAAVTENEAQRLSEASALLAFPVCFALAALLGCFIAFDWFGFGQLPWWAPPCALIVLLLQAGIQVMQANCVRLENPTMIGKAGVSLNAARSASQIAGGAFWGSGLGLAAGELVGRLVSFAHLWRTPGAWRFSQSGYDFKNKWPSIKKYRQFPLVLLLPQVIEGAVYFLQIAVLNSMFGVASVGQYFMMRRTLDLPVLFAFRSLTDLFYGRLAALSRANPAGVTPFYVKSVLILAVVGIIGAIPAVFLSEWLFIAVLGAQWAEAGRLAALMVPAAVFNLAVAPAARIFSLSRASGLRYAFTFTYAGGNGLALGLAWTGDWSLYWTTAAISVASCASYGIYFATGVIASSKLITVEQTLE